MAQDPSAAGRLFCVGDIHGCDVAFETLLEQIQLQPADTLVILGDVVDRGPGSCEVMEALLRLEQSCQLVVILGNHEEMMLDALSGARAKFWLRHGGAATLESYGGSIEQVPDEHFRLLHRMHDYWESPTAIFVHANLEPGVDLADQRPEWLRWQRLTGLEFPHPSGKTVICGHTGLESGLPLHRDGWICLDTLAFAGRYLTGLEVATGRVFQASQRGDFREFDLSDLAG